jgi:hypothetical protein
MLTPPQAGAALSYFIYLHVEMDGRPFAQVAIKFSFCDGNAVGVNASGMK